MTEDFRHLPVLPQEVLQYIGPERGGRFIDCTLGGGGHSRLILEGGDAVELLGIDQDEKALQAATENLSEFGSRFSSRRMNFGELSELPEHGWSDVDGILMDIGVSSHQIDEPERGFSYMNDGPLDMRMDIRQELTAAKILNETDEFGLTKIFREYGEERNARRVARAVVKDRQEKKQWERTGEFAYLLQKILGRRKPGTAPVAARCFQALRIAVNRELEVLETGLQSAFDLLSTGGRLVVISFHSLEDRMVKNFFRDLSLTCVCPPDFPVCRCDTKAQLKILSKGAVKASKEEIAGNSRSSCARLRAIEKI
jgi:16S rRNA (cytosine1402-N4)-methyltransferase